MKLMDIDHSILSLANPWLDFMENGEDSTTWATELNNDMENVFKYVLYLSISFTIILYRYVKHMKKSFLGSEYSH